MLINDKTKNRQQLLSVLSIILKGAIFFAILFPHKSGAIEVGIWVSQNECVECINYPKIIELMESLSLPFKIYIDENKKCDSVYYKDKFKRIYDKKIYFAQKVGKIKLEQSMVFLLDSNGQLFLSAMSKSFDEKTSYIFQRQYQKLVIESREYITALENFKWREGFKVDFKLPLKPLIYNNTTGELIQYEYKNESFLELGLVVNIETILKDIYKVLFPYTKKRKNRQIERLSQGNYNYLISNKIISYFQRNESEIYLIVESGVPVKMLTKTIIVSHYSLIQIKADQIKIRKIVPHTALYGYSINPFTGFFVKDNAIYTPCYPIVKKTGSTKFIIKYRIGRNRVKIGRILSNFVHPKYFIEKGLYYNDNKMFWDDEILVFQIDPNIFDVTKGIIYNLDTMANTPMSNQEVMAFYNNFSEYVRTREFKLICNAVKRGNAFVYLKFGDLYYGRLENGVLIETMLLANFDYGNLDVQIIDSMYIVIFNRTTNKVDKVLALKGKN